MPPTRRRPSGPSSRPSSPGTPKKARGTRPDRAPGTRAQSRRKPEPPKPTQRIKPPRPRRMSARTAVLALVLSALALAYAYPIRTYFAQRADIEALETAQQQQRERISALETERAKWNDDAYVITQARIHLLLVRPGEKPLIVIDDPAGAAKDSGHPLDQPAEDPGTWYEKLWGSVNGADKAG